MRHVKWSAAGMVLVAMAGWAAGQGLTREQMEQRVREAAAVKDDAERLKRFDALAAALAPTEHAAAGGWEIERTVSPVTERVTITLTLRATQDVDVGEGKTVRPVITVRIVGRSSEGVFDAGTDVAAEKMWYGSLVLATRVDEYKAREIVVTPSETDSHVLIVRDWESLLHQSVCGKRLLVEFQTVSGKTAVATFDVGNSREAVEAIERDARVKVSIDCPRSLEEDASWQWLDQMVLRGRDVFSVRGKRNVLVFGTAVMQGDSAAADWKPEMLIAWPMISGWLQRYPSGRIRAMTVGWDHAQTPGSDDVAKRLQAWLAQELIDKGLDAARFEVTAATEEQAKEVQREMIMSQRMMMLGVRMEFVMEP